MTAQRRVYYHNAVYHVVSRGNNKQRILEGDQNKALFIEILEKYKERFLFKLYAFVLMDNHAHLIIEANSHQPISKIMQSILLSYSCHFRNKTSYVGHVWQGRFQSSLIEGEQYIVECIAYIHHNPVRANMVNSATDYRWSSACFYDNLNNWEVNDRLVIDRWTLLPEDNENKEDR